jgi:hypothetical protein
VFADAQNGGGDRVSDDGVIGQPVELGNFCGDVYWTR